MATSAPHSTLRVHLHRSRGVVIGKEVLLGLNIFIDNVYPYLITISDGATLTGSHILPAHSKPAAHFKGSVQSFAAPVRIEENVWTGIEAIVLPGVTVGEGYAIFAGSEVTRDVAPNHLVAGDGAGDVKELKPDSNNAQH